MTDSVAVIQRTLRALGNPAQAEHAQRYFKTAKGEYGAGDRFLGIRMPVLRAHVREYQDTALETLEKVLSSRYHEERMFALLVLVRQFGRAAEQQQTAIFDLYLRNTAVINNWDLVDCSAPKIVGPYLQQRDRSLLLRLGMSVSVWERRIAVLACFHFIRNGDFGDICVLAEMLIHDRHDLIHKAVGWMLREIGKVDASVAQGFLDQHCQTMPRTMLRYAIEKYPEPKRQQYLKGLRPLSKPTKPMD